MRRRLTPSTFGLPSLVLCLAPLLGGCAEDVVEPRLPRPPLVVRNKPITGPSPPEWSYWETNDPALRDDMPKVATLPLVAPQVTHPMGAEKRWAALSSAQHDAFYKNGFVAIEAPMKLGTDGDFPSIADLYTSAERDKVPAFLTADALLFVVQAAVDRAVADVEETVWRPALVRLMTSLSAALAVEETSVPLDLADGLRLARGFVAVAAKLVVPGYVPPRDIAPGVGEELRRIENHSGIERSPLFGVTVDYGVFAPSYALRPNDETVKPRVRLAQALSWFAQAPFMLASRGDTVNCTVDVQTARTHARAALLLGRLLAPASSNERATDFAQLRKGLAFVTGAADDPSPEAFAATAQAVGVSLENPLTIANVAKLDHVRRAALERFQPGTYDGVAEVRIPEASHGPTSGGVGRAAHGVRFLGASAPTDAYVLQGLTFPYVGGVTKDAVGLTQQGGHRAFATGVDVVAWLGSTEADKIRHESSDDAYEGFREAEARVVRMRPSPLAPERHASLHMSTLDVLSTYLEPSRGELALPASFSAAYARRKVEVALVAWAHERHDARGFSRPPPYVGNTSKPRPKLEVRDAAVYVEPHPEALGHLLSFVRQSERGLGAAGLAKGSRGAIALGEVSDIVEAAYLTATRSANGEAPTVELVARLARFGDRIQWLEQETGLLAGVVLATQVHQDSVSGRVSVAGITGLTEVHVAIRDPRSGDLVHAVGARLSGLEAVWPRSRPIHDAALREDFAKSPVPPMPWVSAFSVR